MTSAIALKASRIAVLSSSWNSCAGRWRRCPKVGARWRPAEQAVDALPGSQSCCRCQIRWPGSSGGLPKGTVAVLSSARSLPVGMVAAVTGAGGHAAVVGLPEFGLLAAAEMGADLSRLAVIPDPGTDPVEVAAVLMDGMDLVVLGLAGVRCQPPGAGGGGLSPSGAAPC